MARCEVCDLELDEVERFCPGCGVPAPRRVVEVSTGLRESFHSATSDDEDTEYAFGTKRVVKTAPIPLPAPERAARERRSKGRRAVRRPEPVQARPEPEPQRPPLDLEQAPEIVREPDPEPEPPVTEIEQIAVPEAEPDIPEIELVEDAEPTDEERVSEADEAPEIDDGAPADGADVVPGAEDGFADLAPVEYDEAVPAPPAPALTFASPVSTEPEPIKPYVVLPIRRAVAVREPVVVAETDDVAAAQARKRGGWKAVVLVLVLLLVGAAGAYVLTGRGGTHTGRPFTAEARDAAISLDAPAGWRLESRGNGVLGIGEAAHDMHVHATAIRRSALADGLSLKRRADQVHQEFIASLEGAEASRAETTKVGPYAAIRQVLSTDSVTYVHTVVKMPTYFVNVLAWTSAERFAQEQDVLLGVVATLRSSG